jgi:hypothetical protein
MRSFIRLPEGIDVTKCQLIRLHEKKVGREFRTITGGVFHKSSGPRRDMVPFNLART